MLKLLRPESLLLSASNKLKRARVILHKKPNVTSSSNTQQEQSKPASIAHLLDPHAYRINQVWAAAKIAVENQQLKQNIAKITAEKKTAESAVEERDSIISTLQEEKQDSHKELCAARDDLVDEEEDNESLRDKCSSLSKQIESLRDDLTSESMHKEHLFVLLIALRKENNRMRDSVTEKKNLLKATEERFYNLTAIAWSNLLTKREQQYLLTAAEDGDLQLQVSAQAIRDEKIDLCAELEAYKEGSTRLFGQIDELERNALLMQATVNLLKQQVRVKDNELQQATHEAKEATALQHHYHTLYDSANEFAETHAEKLKLLESRVRTDYQIIQNLHSLTGGGFLGTQAINPSACTRRPSPDSHENSIFSNPGYR